LKAIIETERMYLREFVDEDLNKLSEIYADEEVMKYIGKGGRLDSEQSKKIIEAWTKKYYKQYGFGIWAVIDKESNSLIGHCGFNVLKDGSEIEIAYLLEKKYWGKGFATEISKATLLYGFEKLKLKRIVALAYPENIQSVNVINKLGMKPEGERIFFDTKFLFFSKEKFTAS